MRSWGLGAAIALVGVSCLGCVPKSIEGKVLVVGYLDLSHDAPAELGWATMKQVSPETSAPFRPMSVTRSGIAYQEVPVGTHLLAAFGGQGKRYVPCVGVNQSTLYRFELPDDSKVGTIDAKEPGIHFFGAYRFVSADKRKGVFKQNQDFGLAPLDYPAEAEVLLQLLKRVKRNRGILRRLFAGPSPWEAVIEKRLENVHRVHE